MSKKWIRAAAVAGTTAAITVSAVVWGAMARADDPPAPSSLVEDFSYPGAAAILAAQNVKLISGNGKIMIADCSNPPNAAVTFIYVYTSDLTVNGGDPVCFRVLGTPGVLTMEVPAVFEIRGDGRTAGSGDGHDVTAVVRPQGGDATTIQLDSDGSTPIGIGTDPPGPPTTLLQLTAKG
jgi:hypothetical protein